MKTLILAVVLGVIGFVSESRATSYCYDSAYIAVSDFEDALKECDPNLDVTPFKKLRNALVSPLIGYGPRVLNKLGNTYSHLYTTIPYQSPELSTEVKSCVLGVQKKSFDRVKLKVLDALVVCRL